MSDEHAMHEPDPADPAAADHHGLDDHDDGATLGSIDVAAWGAGMLGIGVALAMAAAFMIATGG